jgi:hypothetical protein
MARRPYENLPVHGFRAAQPFRAAALTSVLLTALAIVLMTAISLAAELPEAPSSVVHANSPMVEGPASVSASENKEAGLVDNKFISLALVSTGSTFADSYTTLFARQNWLAHRQGVCNEEVESAYLYGTHPTVGRAYAVASVKSAGAIFSAYYLRKHRSKLWALPLIANSAISLQGVTQNMMACN